MKSAVSLITDEHILGHHLPDDMFVSLGVSAFSDMLSLLSSAIKVQLLSAEVSAAICEGPRSVPQGKYSTGTGTTVLDLAVHS